MTDLQSNAEVMAKEGELKNLVAQVGAFEKPASENIELNEYEKLAEALIAQIQFSHARSAQGGPDTALLDGFVNHMECLFHSLNWFDPRTMRRFYADMRKWADEEAAEEAAATKTKPRQKNITHIRRGPDTEIPF